MTNTVFQTPRNPANWPATFSDSHHISARVLRMSNSHYFRTDGLCKELPYRWRQETGLSGQIAATSPTDVYLGRSGFGVGTLSCGWRTAFGPDDISNDLRIARC